MISGIVGFVLGFAVAAKVAYDAARDYDERQRDAYTTGLVDGLTAQFAATRTDNVLRVVSGRSRN